jgi:hypothetical protein
MYLGMYLDVDLDRYPKNSQDCGHRVSPPAPEFNLVIAFLASQTQTLS